MAGGRKASAKRARPPALGKGLVEDMAEGLLAVAAGPLVVRWLPPLNVTRVDVQTALGWNNADFDNNVASIKFAAGTQVMGNQTRWQCSGGEQSQTSLVTQKRNVTATPTLNANGKQLTGRFTRPRPVEVLFGARALPDHRYADGDP